MPQLNEVHIIYVYGVGQISLVSCVWRFLLFRRFRPLAILRNLTILLDTCPQGCRTMPRLSQDALMELRV
ncbi:MAG: hypothetical protein A2V98_05170 [Planctomycetes bacterium RBG_16_64_12]|nr:MAG: hypothetical protein A2V98_05170 [Planctomycetes bacterium RBG_16_64_12]